MVEPRRTSFEFFQFWNSVDDLPLKALEFQCLNSSWFGDRTPYRLPPCLMMVCGVERSLNEINVILNSLPNLIEF